MERHRAPLLTASQYSSTFPVQITIARHSYRLAHITRWQAYVVRGKGTSIVGWRLFQSDLTRFIDVHRDTMALHLYDNTDWEQTLLENLGESHGGTKEELEEVARVHLMFMAFGISHDHPDFAVPWAPPIPFAAFAPDEYSLRVLRKPILQYGNSYASI